MLPEAPLCSALEQEILPCWLPQRRWFAGKGRAVAGIRVERLIPVWDAAVVALVRVDFADEKPGDLYQVPLTLEAVPGAEALGVIEGREVFEATGVAGFQRAVMRLLLGENCGALVGVKGGALERLAGGDPLALAAVAPSLEQSNSALIYGGRIFVKLFRRVVPGVNPDAEVLRFLTERRGLNHVPQFAGAIELSGEPAMPLALATGVIEDATDAWAWANAEAAKFYDAVEQTPGMELARAWTAAGFVEKVTLLGRRTGELHAALYDPSAEADFAPEAFTSADARTLAEAVRQAWAGLQPELAARGAAGSFSPEKMLAALAGADWRGAARTRTHGDFHLGQVLCAGGDFVILDFEGEPARPLAERRAKTSPLRDVAGMQRSFHYAAHHALGTRRHLHEAAEFWAAQAAEAYGQAWLGAVAQVGFLPSAEATSALLRAYTLEKALYEVAYELHNRPDWLHIPLSGVRSVMAE